MRRALLGAVAAAALLAGPARAVDIVSDPLVENATVASLAKDIIAEAKRVEMVNNQIIQITHAVTTINAVMHGNIAAISSLAPELADLGITLPLGTDMGELAKSLGGLASELSATGMLTQQLLQADRYYGPTAADWRAAAMNTLSAQLAARKALAQQSLESSTTRLAAMQKLRSQLDGKTTDVAAAAQASARIAAENGITQVQANQLAAARMLSEANTATTAAREDQVLRCSADNFVTAARAAAAAANGGAVTLISASSSSSSTSCTVSTTTTPTTTDTTGTLVASTSSGDTSTTGALNTMLAQSWGQQAADNATAIGVNANALAATCVMESGCQTNVGGTGTISGVMQMTNGAFQEGLQTASASGLDTSQLNGGKNDPVTQAAAAAGYLRTGAQSLQARGITDPSVLDVRGTYQFGAGNGASIAQASDSQLMAPLLSGLSSSSLAANGITSATTVGQWRQTVTNKIGAAASQPVLIGGKA